MKCSICKCDIRGYPKEDTSDHQDGKPIVCIYCIREKYKPGTLIELAFSILDKPYEYEKFNDIKGIIVRPLETHEDLAGCFDYIISWDWKDDRLYEFLRTRHGDNPRDLLDLRIQEAYIKAVE